MGKKIKFKEESPEAQRFIRRHIDYFNKLSPEERIAEGWGSEPIELTPETYVEEKFDKFDNDEEEGFKKATYSSFSEEEKQKKIKEMEAEQGVISGCFLIPIISVPPEGVTNANLKKKGHFEKFKDKLNKIFKKK